MVLSDEFHLQKITVEKVYTYCTVMCKQDWSNKVVLKMRLKMEGMLWCPATRGQAWPCIYRTSQSAVQTGREKLLNAVWLITHNLPEPGDLRELPDPGPPGTEHSAPHSSPVWPELRTRSQSLTVLSQILPTALILFLKQKPDSQEGWDFEVYTHVQREL